MDRLYEHVKINNNLSRIFFTSSYRVSYFHIMYQLINFLVVSFNCDRLTENLSFIPLFRYRMAESNLTRVVVFFKAAT